MNDANRVRQDALPPLYQEAFSPGKRALGIIAFTIAVSTFAVALISIAAITVHFTQHVTFSQSFIKIFAHITAKQLVIGSGVAAVLVIGAAVVIHRARKNPDPLINSEIFCADNTAEYIEEALYEFRKENGEVVRRPTYIDKSTLRREGRERAYLYVVQGPVKHYWVTTLLTLATPLYVAQTMLYHLLRIVPIFLYTLGCYLKERGRAEALFPDQRRFTLLDVIKQPAHSLWHIVKAPFYGVAYLSAILYSLGDPIGGRILASKIERDWNGGKSRAEGFWSHEGPQKLWRWLGGPEKLDQFNYFLAGCHQPIGIVEYQDGRIVTDTGKSLTEAVQPERGLGHAYEVHSRSSLSLNSSVL